jgi:methanethiol S-methyltransferase
MKYVMAVFMWSAYCALHSYLISTKVTDLLRKRWCKFYGVYRVVYIAISIALLIPLIRWTTQADQTIIIYYSSTLSIIRSLLIYGSLLIFFWAHLFAYDALSFWGIRQILDMGKADMAQEGIKKSGLLGLVRHPMYFALIIFLWCHTFRIMDVVVNTLLTVYIIIGTCLEENKLVLEFGNSYREYQREVPMLVPLCKRKHKSENKMMVHGLDSQRRECAYK